MNLDQARRQFEIEDNIGNATNLIAQCMRNNLINEKYVRYCAALGDEICKFFYPREEQMTVEKVLQKFDSKVSVTFAWSCAKKAYSILENFEPPNQNFWWRNNEEKTAVDMVMYRAKKYAKVISLTKSDYYIDLPSLKRHARKIRRYFSTVRNISYFTTDFTTRYAIDTIIAMCSAIIGENESHAYFSLNSAYALAHIVDETDKELLIDFLMKDILPC